FLGHLLDRFDLEFFGVTLTTHGTSYLGLIMRLGGVYETRGDSGETLADYLPDTLLPLKCEVLAEREAKALLGVSTTTYQLDPEF
ncbi:hypothetical protein LJG08_33835, partial [Pseudomonas aeruginosa]|nr:hypothetical protein [Pseudomonas aeruginosa]